MHKAVATELSTSERTSQQLGITIPFDAICSPGAYICNWSGQLMRIPERTLVPGEALRINIIGREPLTVTKISDDPRVPLVQARNLATTLGVRANF